MALSENCTTNDSNALLLQLDEKKQRQKKYTIVHMVTEGVTGRALCHAPPFGPRRKAKKCKIYSTLQLRNQIVIKHACGRGLRYLAF